MEGEAVPAAFLSDLTGIEAFSHLQPISILNAEDDNWIEEAHVSSLPLPPVRLDTDNEMTF